MAGATPARLVFGHTHWPSGARVLAERELVNPGSVGMPLDGDHRAAYALVDGHGALEQHRVCIRPSGQRPRCSRGARRGGETPARRIERARFDAG